MNVTEPSITICSCEGNADGRFKSGLMPKLTDAVVMGTAAAVVPKEYSSIGFRLMVSCAEWMGHVDALPMGRAMT